MKIHTIKMGITWCYVIQDKGTIMVDCGPPDKLDTFLKAMKKASIDPKQIKLIVHTHGHWDHIGSTKAIKEATGAQIAMHEPDKEWLEKSLHPLPPGVNAWGRFMMKLSARFMIPANLPATLVDIVLPDKEFSLKPFGISGKVLFTPGHSMGSVSVLLETGEAFVGDLAMNGLPFRLSPGLTILAESMEKVKESWRILLDQGAKMIYIGHGKPFPAEIIRKALG
jgi:hydroxyacylglutathione hydrolase